MTHKTRCWLIVDSFIILLITLLAIWLAGFAEPISIWLNGITNGFTGEIVSSVIKGIIYIGAGIVDFIIIIFFLFFWWSENKWRNIKRYFGR